jgi:hypothetical protein
MARTIDDCVLAMTVLADMPEPPPLLEGLSVGLVGPIDDLVRVESLAASVETTSIPSFEHLIPLHLAEFARTHRRLFAEQGSRYSKPCARMLERGLAIGDEEQQRLREELAVWRERCRQELPFDVLIGPTLSREPPLLEDVETLELLLEMSWLTRPFNMLGWRDATCRDGVMFAGPSDALVLGAALAWENGLPPPRTA